MEIKIQAEFTAKTFADTMTYCTTYKFIISDFRDVYHVDDVVKYVKAILTNKGARDAMVTFNLSNDWGHTIGISRLAANYDGTVDIVEWDERGNTTKHENAGKPTAKVIKKMYLEVADKCIEKNEPVVA